MDRLSFKPKFGQIILIVSLICIGLFYEALSCAVSVAMIVWLAINHIHKGKTVFKLNIYTVAIAVLCFFYGITAFWGIDSGMSVVGFFKFMPLILFLLVLYQTGERERIIHFFPYVSMVIVAVSFVCSIMPVIGPYFQVVKRFAGFFQYPNTFAIFILVAQVLLLSREKLKWFDWLVVIGLIMGLVYTSSRTVYIVAIVANVAVLLFTKPRKQKILLFLAAVALGTIGLIAYVAITGHTLLIERVFSYSFTESTFVGRLLYYQDALGTILRNPFGLGYKGYFFIQPSIQTGVYSIAYVHNDLLQIMLDIGWIPAIGIVAMVLKTVFSKGVEPGIKIALLALCGHSLFDFNLQFVAMFLVLILLCNFETGKEVEIKGKKGFIAAVSAILAAITLYLGIGLALCRLDQNELSYKFIPWYTENEIIMMSKSNDISEVNRMADRLLARNDRVLIGYSAKARYYYSEGNFSQMMAYKRIVLEYGPFQYDEYVDYAQMLVNGANLYAKSGDENSLRICLQELVRVKNKLHSLENRLSPLGKMIEDQPTTQFPAELEEYIEKLELSK